MRTLMGLNPYVSNVFVEIQWIDQRKMGEKILNIDHVCADIAFKSLKPGGQVTHKCVSTLCNKYLS